MYVRPQRSVFLLTQWAFLLKDLFYCSWPGAFIVDDRSVSRTKNRLLLLATDKLIHNVWIIKKRARLVKDVCSHEAANERHDV